NSGGLVAEPQESAHSGACIRDRCSFRHTFDCGRSGLQPSLYRQLVAFSLCHSPRLQPPPGAYLQPRRNSAEHPDTRTAHERRKSYRHFSFCLSAGGLRAVARNRAPKEVWILASIYVALVLAYTAHANDSGEV